MVVTDRQRTEPSRSGLLFPVIFFNEEQENVLDYYEPKVMDSSRIHQNPKGASLWRVLSSRPLQDRSWVSPQSMEAQNPLVVQQAGA